MNTEKEAWTYTKWLTALNTVLYFGVVLFCLIAWMMKGKFPSSILQSVSVPYMSVMAFYFAKSLLEKTMIRRTRAKKESEGEA